MEALHDVAACVAPSTTMISKSKLEARFVMFNRGNWTELIRASAKCDDLAAVSRRRHARRQGIDDDLKRRVARAEMLVHYGELSSARQALEGASLAPGNQETLNMLRDESRRPPRLRDPLPEELLNLVPEDRFELDEDRFCRNLRSARRGAAEGPSGVTTEHLRPLLDDVRGMRLLSCLASNLAVADVPEVAVQMVRVGRLTALTKPDGGVRGIVAGDVVRRLVSRTIAQQLSAAVETVTAPHQYALSTKAGTECIAHVLQSLTELHPEATVTSIDGISAYDLISREAMLQGLARVEGGRSALPFVRLFYGAPSEYLWEDESGTTHRIPQGEGGEQGDAMMPLLFCLGQHEALRATQEQLRDGEHLLAFLDDIYMVTRPDRVGPCMRLSRRTSTCTLVFASIAGRQKSGTKPASDPQRVMHWRGSRASGIHVQLCGRGQEFPRMSKGSKFLGPRSAMRTSWRRIWSLCWLNTTLSSVASPR